MSLDFHRGEDRLEFDRFDVIQSIADLQIVRHDHDTVITVPDHGTVELLGVTATPPPATSSLSRSGCSAPQGNRVKKSCGDKACEEIVVPGGDFAPKAQGVFARSFSDQVVSHVFDGGEVGGGVFGADAAFVIAEDHVHDPVQTVFHRPMTADDRPHLCRPGAAGM